MKNAARVRGAAIEPDRLCHRGEEAFGLEMYDVLTYDYLLTILTASIIPVSIWLRPTAHAVLKVLSYVNGVYYTMVCPH